MLLHWDELKNQEQGLATGTLPMPLHKHTRIFFCVNNKNLFPYVTGLVGYYKPIHLCPLLFMLNLRMKMCYKH